jgi:hypothetical protein
LPYWEPQGAPRESAHAYFWVAGDNQSVDYRPSTDRLISVTYSAFDNALVPQLMWRRLRGLADAGRALGLQLAITLPVVVFLTLVSGGPG